jgi:hypothetical protein
MSCYFKNVVFYLDYNDNLGRVCFIVFLWILGVSGM